MDGWMHDENRKGYRGKLKANSIRIGSHYHTITFNSPLSTHFSLTNSLPDSFTMSVAQTHPCTAH